MVNNKIWSSKKFSEDQEVKNDLEKLILDKLRLIKINSHFSFCREDNFEKILNYKIENAISWYEEGEILVSPEFNYPKEFSITLLKNSFGSINLKFSYQNTPGVYAISLIPIVENFSELNIVAEFLKSEKKNMAVVVLNQELYDNLMFINNQLQL